MAPTVEGCLINALNRSWGVRVVGIDRSTRTPKGVHAVANVLVMTVQPSLPASFTDEALRSALDGTGIALLGSLRGPGLPAQLDKARVACKRIYHYAVPYSALLTTEERAQALERNIDGVWLCNIPSNIDARSLEHLLAVERESVSLNRGGGTAEVELQANTTVEQFRTEMHQRVFEGCDHPVLVLPLCEARIKLGVHRRIKAVLRALSDTVNGQRSFHNFCHPDCVHTRRSLQHCSSGIQQDICHPGPTWCESHMVVLSFSAQSFGAQQLQRMTGALVAVVRGEESIECVSLPCCIPYID